MPCRRHNGHVEVTLPPLRQMRDVERENSVPMLGGWSVRASLGNLELRAQVVVADFKGRF